jgi:hypothetical protein
VTGRYTSSLTLEKASEKAALNREHTAKVRELLAEKLEELEKLKVRQVTWQSSSL